MPSRIMASSHPRTYDYLAKARRQLFDWIRPLTEDPTTEDHYTREFNIGPGSLARTLNHTMHAESYYVLRMLDQPVPPIEELIRQYELPLLFQSLEPAWHEQEQRTREAINTITDWHAPITYTVTRDDRPLTVHTNPHDIFTQLTFHEIHHRAQALNILRQLGVTTGDIDYNVLMYRFE